MNKEAEMMAQLRYWGYINDWEGAKRLLIRLKLMDKKDFGRAWYRYKEIESDEENANILYKQMKEKGI